MDELHKQVGQVITERCANLAAATVATEFDRHPELEKRYGKIAREKCLQDARYHLCYLAAAIAAEDPALFCDYIAWAKIILAKRNVLAADLAFHLDIMRNTLRSLLPDEMRSLTWDYLSAGLEQLPQLPEDVPTFMRDHTPLAATAQQYLQALLRGEKRVASQLVLEAVEQGVSIRDIYLHVFQRSQYEIGRLWQINRLSVAQEHYCTAATQLIMSQLYPYIFSSAKGAGTMVATCVAGDLHEIGVRMLADFFEMEGWDTFYLGANTPQVSVLQTIAERQARLLAVSATMTFHLQAVADLISAVRAAAGYQGVKILVGGYPFNLGKDLWKKVGADGYAANAQDALSVAARLAAEEQRQ